MTGAFYKHGGFWIYLRIKNRFSKEPIFYAHTLNKPLLQVLDY